MANGLGKTVAKSRRIEVGLWEQGIAHVCGVDEVGMGCLAGPVVAAAVILNPLTIPKGIKDSKQLSAKKREELDTEIRSHALAFAIAHATVEEIDTINILQASRLAMKRAIAQLALPAHYLLIDGRFTLDYELPQQALIGGDGLSVSIGAASIIAKVFRDKWMTDIEAEFPGYGFASHKGYGSVEHRTALGEKGVTRWHRKSFSWTPVRGSSPSVLREPGL